MKYLGRNLSKTQLKIVVRELRTIEKKQGMITPVALVESARPLKAPLHGFFEWDVMKNAEAHLLWQARMLIARVYVKVTDKPDEKPLLRAFVSVKETEEPEEDDEEETASVRGYVGLDVARSRASFKLQVVQYAYDQLVGWKRRFGGYKQFLGVTGAIDDVKL